MIKIDIDDGQVIARFGELGARAGDMTPIMRQIGEVLVDSTKQRFGAGAGPDGVPWKPNTATTVARFLRARHGSKAYSKRHKGQLTKFGATAAANKKPLIGETRRLSTEIHYRVGSNSVLIGSGLIQSAVMQFGAKKGAFGKTKRGAPIPWGDIPARPFLGLSDSDRGLIADLAAAYLAE